MIWHQFQRPTAVNLEPESAEDTYGRFVAQPLERGWGTTVGNALRRSLLSSIPGLPSPQSRLKVSTTSFRRCPALSKT